MNTEKAVDKIMNIVKDSLFIYYNSTHTYSLGMGFI